MITFIEGGDGRPGSLSLRALECVRRARRVVVHPDTDPRQLAVLLDIRSDIDIASSTPSGAGVVWVAPHFDTPPAEVPFEWLAPAPRPSGNTLRPLEGIGMVLTRPRHQALPLMWDLEALGAHAWPLPSVRIEPLADTSRLDATLEHLRDYDWLIFTSANSIPLFMQRLLARGLDSRHLSHLKVATIGPATARALESWGLRADVQPEEFVAESLIAALPKGARYLLPRAEEARDVLPASLGSVDVVPLYRTVPEPSSGPWIERLLERGCVQAVLFTASSTVRYFPCDLPGDVAVICIGPITAEAARNRGWTVASQAVQYTAEGLVDACIRLAPHLR